jgi:hypothetical protein
VFRTSFLLRKESSFHARRGCRIFPANRKRVTFSQPIVFYLRRSRSTISNIATALKILPDPYSITPPA